MGTFTRMRYVIAANVNALLEKAEDPEKLLRALIREMEDAADEARLASADLLAEQKHYQRLGEQLAAEAAQWRSRAETAVTEERDDLARAALAAAAETESREAEARRHEQQLVERLTLLEQDMRTLKQKRGEATHKLKALQHQPARGPGNSTVRPASRSELRVERALGRFDRLQTQVENLEARVQSYDIGGPAPAAWSTEQTAAASPAVELELELLKQRLGTSTKSAGEPPSVAQTEAAP